MRTTYYNLTPLRTTLTEAAKGATALLRRHGNNGSSIVVVVVVVGVTLVRATWLYDTDETTAVAARAGAVLIF